VLLQDGSRANTEEGDIVGEFTDQELIYFPRDPRADHLYGLARSNRMSRRRNPAWTKVPVDWARLTTAHQH
jgi:hypothetical protein